MERNFKMKKKNKILRWILLVILAFCLTGCGVKYPDLNDNTIPFDMGEYTDENDGGLYGTIEYNGRTYMPYGTIKKSLKSKDINECIGYIIQNENSSSIVDLEDKDTRIYTLVEDPDENYLMEYYIGDTLMNQPSFWRAIDTKGKKIDTPKYIESLDYNYWE